MLTVVDEVVFPVGDDRPEGVWEGREASGEQREGAARGGRAPRIRGTGPRFKGTRSN